MFEAKGLTVPDCVCFNTKLKVMNDALDKIGAVMMLEVAGDMRDLNICDKARDYRRRIEGRIKMTPEYSSTYLFAFGSSLWITAFIFTGGFI